ncbi:hypothetical protein SAMN05192561_10826 [Halopenitus malekzadehii]|uniref:DUF7968 domain-containing protein n=1 Tax=Halopenitus malekzadehii TaxID=1267564 RepID=A0A1H6J4K2_9EURY|nr:hypothetical protein [Halopenitus malekzadehii]SEH57006.1 hypothetical protein SAMN05192561_10826 [Halopenitus malekzadehii]
MSQSDSTDSTDSTATATSARPTATRVVLSMPEGVSGWVRSQIDTDRYRGYFRRTLGEVSVGDVTEEFVDIGCCGNNLDIPFRVERIEVDDGGNTGSTDGTAVEVAVVDEQTAIEYVDREGDVEGGWKVQSADGPTR